MEILFLGTSGVGVTAERNPPAILIDRSIVIDCGEGFFRRLLENQVNPLSIKAVFLTHLHADHVLGLLSLLWRLAFYQHETNFSQQRESFPIYLPWGMSAELEKILGSTYSTFNNVKFKVNIIELPLKPQEKFMLDINKVKYSINWIKTKHDPLCYAYKFNNKLVISGDTAPFPKFTKFVENVDILIHEASFSDDQGELAHRINHSTPSDAAQIAQTADVKQLILTHVPNLSKNEEPSFLIQAKTLFDKIFVAKDNQVVLLK